MNRVLSLPLAQTGSLHALPYDRSVVFLVPFGVVPLPFDAPLRSSLRYPQSINFYLRFSRVNDMYDKSTTWSRVSEVDVVCSAQVCDIPLKRGRVTTYLVHIWAGTYNTYLARPSFSHPDHYKQSVTSTH
jgi:hypothetical protein